MVNAWSLLYDELYGDDEMSEEKHSEFYYDYARNDPDRENPFKTGDVKVDGHSVNKIPNKEFMSDTITLGGDTIMGNSWHGRYDYPSSASNDTISFTTTPPTPSLDKQGVFKYNEDKALKDAKDYVRSTYSGHYTTKGSNTQTLDLIESVGDAESFCRSNALKYLSRYDKKGTAKSDILKAMHYCLLLYYFSGQTNETETRGYETF